MSGPSTAPVRSYKRRGGRTGAQAQHRLAHVLPRYAVAVTGGQLDQQAVFGRVAPLVVEIGAGMGEATAALAAAEPARDVLACEVHTAGLASLAGLLADTGLTNVRVVDGDGTALLRERICPAALDEVRVLFPDPWPKARHAKRRLLSPGFCALVADRLRPGGRLHLATDWPAYVEHALAALATCSALNSAVVDRPPTRPVTGYERRGLADGRPAYDIVAVRREESG